MEAFGASQNMALYKRLLLTGPSASSDANLLAVLLAGSTGGNDPLIVAHKLLEACRGDLSKLSNKHVTTSVPGIGPAGYARIVAAAELFERAVMRSCVDEPSTVHSASDAWRSFRALGLENVENLAGLYLDRRHHVLGMRILSKGNSAHTIVDPREVIRPALELGASAIIMAHNHPSGVSEPSTADIEVSHRVGDAATIMGLDFLDSLVIAIGQNRYSSLRELGLLKPRSNTGTAFLAESSP